MTMKCRPFYSMQEIIQNGNVQDFHRKFGKSTKGTHGVYIWGFAQDWSKLSQNEKNQIDVQWPLDPMNEFAVNVKSQDIGIYYIGKATSINIFERIMQERANLFGGFFPIYAWNHYFTATPFLSIWNQLHDQIASSNLNHAHSNRLKKYKDCRCSNLNPFQSSTPIIYSNACFNEYNLMDRIMQGESDLSKQIKKMSKNFIFTWIEIVKEGDIPTVEKTLHGILGVNILGVGGIKRIGAINPGKFSNYQINNSSVSIDFNSNQELYKRIEQINRSSISLHNNCKCFKN